MQRRVVSSNCPTPFPPTEWQVVEFGAFASRTLYMSTDEDKPVYIKIQPHVGSSKVFNIANKAPAKLLIMRGMGYKVLMSNDGETWSSVARSKYFRNTKQWKISVDRNHNPPRFHLQAVYKADM